MSDKYHKEIAGSQFLPENREASYCDHLNKKLCEERDKTARLETQISILRKALKNAKIDHFVCEDDPFFSCEATDSFFECHGEIRGMPRICSCGADSHNELIDIALSFVPENKDP